MAAIRCPHCNYLMELKGVRPGKFTPTCARCGERFRMEISDDAHPKAYVSKIKPKKHKPEASATHAPAAAHATGHDAPPASPAGHGATDQTLASPAHPHHHPAPLPPPVDEEDEDIELDLAALTDAVASSLDDTVVTKTPEAAAEEVVPEAEILADSDPGVTAPSVPAPRRAPERAPAPDMGAPRANRPDNPNVTAPSSPRPAPRKPDPAVTAPSAVKAPPRTADAGLTLPSRAAAPAAAAAPPPATSPPPAAPSQADLAGVLGGYQIEKKLGEGGMGAVYLARQLSLDRNVALKTMHPQWASDPTFLARFTREAYAAAQLSHHHVVHIHDIGQDKGTPFFSMEFVKGQSLADLIKREGKLDPEAAVGYILQAARGLKFAHDQGMVHRDVKPENLLLNDQGILKVADLGLVKTSAGGGPPSPAGGPAAAPAPRIGGGKSAIATAAGANVTLADVAMGTPAYMAPEQAVDAARADARADIYSLGCTLYVMVTGRAPFPGNTIMEVITKHATEPITPPELIVQRVPKELSGIIQKMVAKKPEERYQDMGQVIKVLEDFLGVSSSGPFSPREEHAKLLEENVNAFYKAPTAGLRRLAILNFYGLCLILTLVLGFLHKPLWAGGFVGLAVLTTILYQVVIGITRKTYLFRKARQLVFGSRIVDWLAYLGVAALVVALLVAFNLHWVWLGFCVVALGVALGFALIVDRRLIGERRGPIFNVEEMLKSMRLRGLEEQALRQFVCKYAGERWELFYEELFGYEAKIEARELWSRGDRGRLRKKDGARRDAIIRWIDQKMDQRRQAKEKKMLQALEEKSLRARGVSAGEAQRQAKDAADTLVTKAAAFKEAAAEGKPISARSISDTGAMDDDAKMRHKARNRIRSGPLVWLFGRRTRFVLGAILLAGCGLWMNQNNMMSAERVEAMKQLTTAEGRQAAAGTARQAAAHTKPLHIIGVPAAATDFFDSFNPGVAGLLLIISAFFGRWPLGLFVIPAAAVAFAGHRFGIPSVGPIAAAYLAMAAGVVIAAVGFVVARK